MVFLFNVNFPEHRLLHKSLTRFFGIGPQTSSRLLAAHHLHPLTRMRELAPAQVLELNASLGGMKIENELRRKVLEDIWRLKDCGCYRGRRHMMRLPVRGQGTRKQIKTAAKLNMIERRL